MAALPPNRHEHLMRPSSTKMAVTHSTKAKPASKAVNASPKSKTQMHRRSRTGCYTCRLRRKKCDEGSPLCTACKHLGLECEYKRPVWWGNTDARKKHKEDIKVIIKRKKLTEKTAHTIQTTAIGSPPGLSHSLPTSATFSDPADRTRSGSVDSHFSAPFNFNSSPSTTDFGFCTPQIPAEFIMTPGFSPYEIDIKTERQMFINDVPALHESTIATFSTLHTPPPPGTILPSNEWVGQMFEERRESLTEEIINVKFFDFPHGPARQVAIELDERDQVLLDHFLQFILPAIFPILDCNQHGSVGSDLVLPALQNNRCYLHCCLSIAAQHMKATMGITDSEIDQDIMRHRCATISTLCEALGRDENHQEILEAALGLIFLQCIVGRLDDCLPDIPWHQHFQAAINLVQKLDLQRLVSDPSEPSIPAPFNMTLTAWIDILGAAMQGRAPQFAHTYREKHLSPTNCSLGLRELMGCDDNVMYLISEIACLEALKHDGMDDITLCQHVHTLGDQIGLTELNEPAPRLPYNANGTLSPKQLTKNITAAFRLAARIYLCSLVPGFNPGQASCIGLVEKLTTVLHHIPPGPHGFDRSLVWVYLIGGSVSLANSSFRPFFHDRLAQLGDLGLDGAFGRVSKLLVEVWQRMDTPSIKSSGSPEPEPISEVVPYFHWRDIMINSGWDFIVM